MTLVLPGTALPVLRDVELAVIGGSVAGVAAALAGARAGLSVCVLESTTYLGHELTALMRPWISAEDASAGDPLGILDAVLGTPREGVPAAGDVPVRPDAVKRALEELLAAAGVDLLYGVRLIDVYEGEDGRSRAVLADKSGRQLVRADRILASRESVGGLGGARPEERRSWFSLEVTGAGIDPVAVPVLPVPGALGLVGDEVRVRPGHRGDGHLLLECAADLAGPGSATDRARRLAVRVFGHLVAARPEFSDAWLAGTSYRAHAARPTPPEERAVPLLDDPGPALGLHGSGTSRTSYGDLIRSASRRVAEGDALPPAHRGSSRADQGDEAALLEPAPPAHWDVTVERSAVRPIDSVLDVDVLVVGGGSSGAACGVAAASRGARTLVADMNPGVGGSGTFGGVDSYWFGRSDGLASGTREQSLVTHRALGLPGGSGRKWNIEAKADVLLGSLQDSGADVLTDAVAFAALGADGRVAGAVLATEAGVLAVRAAVVVDATGDADVAAAAGATTRMGAERTHAAMWYSLAQFAEPGRSRNNFGGVVDTSDVEDYTRAILAGRRRGGELHDHGVYVAPRESRNIVGDVTLSITQQLTRHHFEDVVNVHFSNHDIKGRSQSIWTLMGLIPPNLEIEVPYRALLPQGLDGILVAGKAISVTHDGLAAVRMQRDLENLGAVVGRIAARCAEEGVSPRTLGLQRMQEELVAEGAFPAEQLRLPPGPRRSGSPIAALVDAVIAAGALHGYADGGMGKVHREGIPFVDLILSDDPAVDDAVAGRMDDVDPDTRMILARILVCRGDSRGADAVVGELRRRLRESPTALPERVSRIKHAQLPPDQAAMPEEAYLLNALALARDARAVEFWEHVATTLDASPEAIRSMTAGTFAYVSAVTLGAERLGDRRALTALRRLHSQPTLRGQTRRDAEPDIFQERQSMLELGIGAALARCGDTEGLEILIRYLDDARGPLRLHAHSELVLLRGADLGFAPDAWASWARSLTALEPAPLGREADLDGPDGLGSARVPSGLLASTRHG
ncbi:MAG TPA: FAD-dependent oxidoreductase [Naasia sp.]